MSDSTCSVDGCEQPRRKRTWCDGHYSMWRRKGEVHPFTYKWGEGGSCRVCGEPARRRGRYCSDACKAMAHWHQGERPEAVRCSGCGKSVDLSERNNDGRRRRADTKLCARCRQDARKHGVSAAFLAVRDGADCGICLEPVDMALTAPALMRPSVDHIIPRALGGSNDPENLQLAHLWCNQVKSDLRSERKAATAL